MRWRRTAPATYNGIRNSWPPGYRRAGKPDRLDHRSEPPPARLPTPPRSPTSPERASEFPFGLAGTIGLQFRVGVEIGIGVAIGVAPGGGCLALLVARKTAIAGAEVATPEAERVIPRGGVGRSERGCGRDNKQSKKCFWH